MADNPQKHWTPANEWGESRLIKSCQAWKNHRKRKEDEQGQHALLLFYIPILSILSSQAPLAITVCSHLLTMTNDKQALENLSKWLKNWNWGGEGAKDCLVGVHRQQRPALLPIYCSQLWEIIKALIPLSKILQHPLTCSWWQTLVREHCY